MILTPAHQVRSLVLRPTTGRGSLQFGDGTGELKISLTPFFKGDKGDQGEKGDSGDGVEQLLWTYYATNWDEPPELVGSIPAGSVYMYRLDGVSRFRLVPSPYDPKLDAFFENFDGATLDDLIATRGW